MLLKSLRFLSYRNLQGLVLLGPGLNFFTGANGQGKSNVLEAVYMACNARSFRAGRLADLIRFGESAAAVELTVERDGVDTPLTLQVTGSERSLCVGGSRDCSLQDAMEYLRVILFGPEDLDLVKGEPSVRRDFLDRAVTSHHPPYAAALKGYQKLVRERNQLLRDFFVGRPPPMGLAEAFEDELSRLAGQITSQRLRYLRELAPLAVGTVTENTSGKLSLSLGYASAAVQPDSLANTDELAAMYRTRLAEARAADIASGHTSVGPHTDDLDVELNGRKARYFASQGEQRQVAVSLKLAQLRLWRSRFGVNPVLLLDDVLSELDPQRARLLLTTITGWNVQTLIATTSVPDVLLDGSVCVFHVEEGKIRHGG